MLIRNRPSLAMVGEVVVVLAAFFGALGVVKGDPGRGKDFDLVGGVRRPSVDEVDEDEELFERRVNFDVRELKNDCFAGGNVAVVDAEVSSFSGRGDE